MINDSKQENKVRYNGSGHEQNARHSGGEDMDWEKDKNIECENEK